jgi:septal ring factor EnvC (AmiA/AmiB activator)
VIAHMGEGPNRAPVLYFEIRQNGKPTDPIVFMPAVK